MKKKSASARIRKRLRLVVTLLGAALILSSVIIAAVRSGSLFTSVLREDGVSLVFLSVEQANCTFIITESGTVLLDTGSNDSESTVLSALSYYGVDGIECIILTHADEDHAGGLDVILESCPVRRVMMTKSTYRTFRETYGGRALEKAISAGETAILTVSEGDVFSLGEAKFEVLVPDEIRDAFSDGSNESSLILLFQYGETAGIFPGDADAEAERLAVSALARSHPGLSYDFLLVAHHGSSTSSCEQFLDYLSPRYAVISCKEYNSYGHPTLEVLKGLQSVGAEILRTDRDGTVILHTDGKTLTKQ